MTASFASKKLATEAMTDTNSQPTMAWARLLRISNLPSAVSNILMGALLASQSWAPGLGIALIVFSSALLYLGGMVLNDVFDVEVDRVERPNRPIPAGAISLLNARRAGFGMLSLAIVIATIAGWSVSQSYSFSLASPIYRAPLVAAILALCVYLYDGPCKRTIAAPMLMGSCRSLNILLGASLYSVVLLDDSSRAMLDPVLGLPFLVWWVAISVGILITGTTWLGRNEAKESQASNTLRLGAFMIFVGLAGIAAAVLCPNSHIEIHPNTRKLFPIAIAFLSLPVLYRVALAVLYETPAKIQLGVISVLRSIILLDAAICYLAVPTQPLFAIFVAALIFPAQIMGKLIPST